MFDLDGTLVNSAPEIVLSANRMLADLNLPTLPSQQIENYIGEGAPNLIKRCLTGQLYGEPDSSLFKQAETLFFAHYEKSVGDSLVYAGVVAGLQALQGKGFKMACVTNKPARFTLPLLKKSGLAHFFEIVVSGDSLPKKKPDPMQLQYICAQFDVPTNQALLVGDSNTDIAAARAAGCFIITVPYGYNQGRSIDTSTVDATVGDLTDLTTLICM